MRKEFIVSERIIVLGILEPYYPVSCLAYAFDVPEEEIRVVLNWYHQGAVRAFSDAVWIMIHEQNLSEDDVREVFSYFDSKAIIEDAIQKAKEEEQTFPDTGDSEGTAEAFQAGYVFSSAVLFHNLKIRTKSSIEEINALFSMNPDMEKWIEVMSHTSDKLEHRNQLPGNESMEKVYEAVTDLFGAEAAARLKEKEAIANLNRSIRELPKDVGIKVAGIINRILAPLDKSGATEDEMKEAMYQALADEGMLPKGMSFEQFCRSLKGDETTDDSGVNYESEYRKQTGNDFGGEDESEQ